MSEVKTVEFHELYVRNKCSAWMRLLWEDNGRVIILSDYGHWSYFWGSIGDQTIEEFLIDLDSHYMGKKMLESEFYVTDDEGTIKAVREHILQCRRDGDIDKDGAREEWELLNDYADGELDVRAWCEASSFDDPWEWRESKANDTWVNFWNRLWQPHAVPALKEYIRQREESLLAHQN